MPERRDTQPLDERAQLGPVPVEPETRDQAPAEPEGYPFCVEALE
jgi:hypothetical protein